MKLNSKAFTVIELIVVIAVLVVLSILLTDKRLSSHIVDKPTAVTKEQSKLSSSIFEDTNSTIGWN